MTDEQARNHHAMLTELDTLPAGLLGCTAGELQDILPGPTLIHLPGRRPEPLFVSILLHGNEDVGLQAMQRLLRKYQGDVLPRALSLFVGNVSAAARGRRRLDGQPDYNRIWPGGDDDAPAPEHAMARHICDTMRDRRVFAAIDLHNNTGLNPHYACINRLEPAFLHLATLFGRTVVYFQRPRGVCSMAMAELCPAVTLECGRVGQARGAGHAAEFVDACLHLSEFPQHAVAGHDIDLFHTVAVAKVPETLSFGFDGEPGHIRFIPELDHLNFRELAAGTPLAQIDPALAEAGKVPLNVLSETGEDVARRFFRLDDGMLQLARPVMPSMLTLDKRVIRQDCLCYLMERMEPPRA